MTSSPALPRSIGSPWPQRILVIVLSLVFPGSGHAVASRWTGAILFAATQLGLLTLWLLVFQASSWPVFVSLWGALGIIAAVSASWPRPQRLPGSSRRVRFSVRFKLIVFVSLLLVAVIVLVTSVTTTRIERILLGVQTQRAADKARDLANNASNLYLEAYSGELAFVPEDDLDEFELDEFTLSEAYTELINSRNNASDILYTLITNRNGIVIRHTDDETRGPDATPLEGQRLQTRGGILPYTLTASLRDELILEAEIRRQIAFSLGMEDALNPDVWFPADELPPWFHDVVEAWQFESPEPIPGDVRLAVERAYQAMQALFRQQRAALRRAERQIEEIRASSTSTAYPENAVTQLWRRFREVTQADLVQTTRALTEFLTWLRGSEQDSGWLESTRQQVDEGNMMLWPFAAERWATLERRVRDIARQLELASQAETPIVQAYSERDALTGDTRRRLDASFPVIGPVDAVDFSEGFVGEVHVGISLDAIEANIETAQLTILYLAAAVVLVALVATFVLATAFTRPIRSIVDALQEIAAGRLSRRVKIRSNDELGLLGDNFNTMAAGLEEREKIRETMYKAVSRDIAEVMLSGQVKLGGETITATIFFSDIRDFTSLSEQMPAEDLIDMLNEYMTAMNAVIDRYQGVVDKFIGDAIMAIWGAPLQHDNEEGIPHDADLACRAALDMAVALVAFNDRRRARSQRPIEIGMGMNTGPVVAGNMGSEERLNYTVIGDGVNLASRLEGATKVYGVPIVISESTLSAMAHPERFVVRELDMLRVKGRARPTRIFELLAYSESTAQETDQPKDASVS